MAVLSSTALTLLDHAKRMDPDGGTADIAELLTQTNEILLDMLWKEGNLPTGNRCTVRTGLPTTYFRLLNQGIPSSKSTTAQIDDGCGILEARSEVDIDVAKLNGNSASFRLSEAVPFMESMNQTMASQIFYGNTATDPKGFNGLSIRYNELAAASGQNIIDAGGTGTDNTSIWLVLWGDQTCFGIFPKGDKAGLEHRDLGEDTVRDADGNAFQAYCDNHKWKAGLTVKDWRYVVRIANIDVSNLTTETGAADVIKLLVKAMARIPSWGMGKPTFYMNRTVYQMLMIQALNKSNSALSVTQALDQFGTMQSWTNFMGVPLRKVDAILNTEARVV